MFYIKLSKKPKFIRPELLFHPQIPQPLHGVNPRSIKGKEWWDETRREAYAENNDCCWACGVHRSSAQPQQWLEAHEVYDINWKKGRMKLKEVVALCPLCHAFIHKGRVEAMVEKHKAQPKFLRRVIAHGLSILDHYGKYEAYEAAVMDNHTRAANGQRKWDKWYLELDGKKYYSRFKNEREWEQYYSRLDSGRK
jgi:hypothetical protein